MLVQKKSSSLYWDAIVTTFLYVQPTRHDELYGIYRQNPSSLFTFFFIFYFFFFLRTLSQKYDAFSHNEIRKTFRD